MDTPDRDLTSATHERFANTTLGHCGKNAMSFTPRAFTNDECVQIIDALSSNIAPELQNTKSWAPLLALFTGLRLDEIANLSTGSVERIFGTWVIQHQTSHYRVAPHVRIIPIHRYLIDVGFLTYWQRQSESGSSYLFPDLHCEDHSVFADSSGEPISKWFKRELLVEIGISNQPSSRGGRVDFASCRLTVLDKFRTHQLPLHVVRTLLGWGVHDFPIDEQENDMPISIAELAAAIRLLDY